VLDRVRRRVGEKRFALGVQLIEGATDPLEISAGLARVAEAAIQVLTDAAVAEFERSHGRLLASELVILGLGRMGGGALTHASDLDLVYLFTGDFQAESDGRRPLAATAYYNRLSQRVTGALSVPTAEGALYEVDTRLRPSGDQGPLAVSIDSFARYQQEQAWTWEHMALCRARPLYGSIAARDELCGIIRGVLTAPRDAAKLRADVIEMRATMVQHKPGKGPLDVKLSRGGLVDVEFIVHYLQLREGKALVPRLGEAIPMLAADGLLPEAMIAAHGTLGRLLVAARLLAPDAQEPPAAAREVLAKSCGCGDWDAVLASLAQARGVVARVWCELFGEELEIV